MSDPDDAAYALMRIYLAADEASVPLTWDILADVKKRCPPGGAHKAPEIVLGLIRAAAVLAKTNGVGEQLFVMLATAYHAGTPTTEKEPA